MNLHVCLVSAQLFANYLPIKVERPDAVFLINTQFTIDKGFTPRFEAMLDTLGIKHYRATQLAPADDFSDLENYFLDVSDEINALHAETITLNMTGGTKLMALAMNEILRDNTTRVIYTNTQAGNIDVIAPEKQAISLPSVLTIDEYLTAYGVSPKNYNNQDSQWVENVEKRRALTKYLVDYFQKDKGFLGTLNYRVQQAITTIRDSNKVELRAPRQEFDKLNHYRREFFARCQEYGLLDVDGNAIYFKNAESAQYLGGFWLEEYAYIIAIDSGVDEVRCGQAIQWDKRTRNELDIVIVHNNRLLIIECKTRKYDKDSRKDNDSIYKLDSVAEDLRGLYGAKWLLSMGSAHDDTKKRARSHDVEFISGEELTSLKERMKQWKQSGR